MADIKQEGILIQVVIKVDTEFGEYNDSIFFTPEAFAAMSEEKLEVEKQTRIDHWVAEKKGEPIIETELGE